MSTPRRTTARLTLLLLLFAALHACAADLRDLPAEGSKAATVVIPAITGTRQQMWDPNAEADTRPGTERILLAGLLVLVVPTTAWIATRFARARRSARRAAS